MGKFNKGSQRKSWNKVEEILEPYMNGQASSSDTNLANTKYGQVICVDATTDKDSGKICFLVHVLRNPETVQELLKS